MKPIPISRVAPKPAARTKSYHRSLPSELPSLKLASSFQLNRSYHSDKISNSSSNSLTSTSNSQTSSLTNQISSIRKQSNVPKSDIDGSILNNKISFDTRIIIENEHEIKNSKKLEPERPNEFAQLFIEKCQEVSYNVYKKENLETKLTLFEHLIGSFQYPTIIRKMNQNCINAVLSSFSNNIFSRVLPAISSFPPCILFDRIENYYDVQWPILQNSYCLLENLLRSSHVPLTLLQQSISHDFVIKLFGCFASPDSRERQYVKSLLYTIAGRIPERGNDIFICIKKSFTDAINGEPIHWGLPQILELLSLIIQSVPQFTANSFNDVLEQNLLPLHLSIDFVSFFVPLTSLIKILIQRNTSNTNLVIIFLLNHFPIASQKKQMAFLKEISEIVRIFYDFITPLTSKMLFERISTLYSDECAEIAEESLSLVYTDGFPQLIEQYFTSVAPILLIRAKEVADKYWSESVTFAALATIQEISKIDLTGFKKISNNIDFYINKIISQEKEREAFWKSVGYKNELPNSSPNSEISADLNKLKTVNSASQICQFDKFKTSKISVQPNHESPALQKGTTSALAEHKERKTPQPQKIFLIKESSSWLGARRYSAGAKSNILQSGMLMTPAVPITNSPNKKSKYRSTVEKKK